MDNFLASDFGLRPDTEEDMTLFLREALQACREKPGASLIFELGRYDFWPEFAFEKYVFASNNDEGLKRIAFPLVGCKGLRIDGRGAQLVFHGPMVPFLIEKSSAVLIRNLSIDFVRTFHSEGVVKAVDADYVDMEISEDFPYEVRHGVLVFTDGAAARRAATTVRSGEVVYPYGSLLAFDPVKRETSFMAWDKYHLENGVATEGLGPGRVRIRATKVSVREGDVLVFGAAQRSYPGFIISDSSRVGLEDVTVFHAGGMGVIAQRSADITLDRLRMTPAFGRMISCSADATHFANCRGRITLRNCIFENQMDDAANFHGLYSLISRVTGPNSFEARLVHPQQAGVEFIQPGMRLEVTRAKCLRVIAETVVESVRRVNKELCLVTTKERLPEDFQEGDVVADAEANTAEVLIQNCALRGNRARGILLGSRGKIVVEGNYFHTPGAAILFEGDACHWFEQAGVRDVTIRENVFDNCNFGVWGDAAIEVRSGIARSARKASRYNRNIVIEGNLFRTFGGNQVLNAYSVEGLIFRQNRLEETSDYPPARAVDSGIVSVVDSDSVIMEEMLPASSGIWMPPVRVTWEASALSKSGLAAPDPAGK